MAEKMHGRARPAVALLLQQSVLMHLQMSFFDHYLAVCCLCC
jgi:hypothetical protein